MADPESLLSLGAIAEIAQAEGFGPESALRRRFIEYEGFGLVGKPLAKAKRQGGEGLWHPMQLELFLQLLHLRQDDGVRVSTLPNLPVGFWRMGFEGITTEQVQKAMSFWGGYLPGAPSEVGLPGYSRRTGQAKSEIRPRGPRSLMRKAIEQVVEEMSVPETRNRAKREMRDLLEIINTTGQAVSPDTWARVALKVIAPSGSPSVDQRRAVSHMQTGILVQLMAIQHLDALCSTPSKEFWDWASRVVDQSQREEYLKQKAQMMEHPELGHLYQRPLGFDLMQRGCLGLMTVLGIGLGVAWGTHGMKLPPGEEPPPTLMFQRRA